MDDSTALSAPPQGQGSSISSRRAMLGSVLGVPLLAACGSDDAESGSGSDTGSDSDSGSDSGSGSGETAAGFTAPTSDIPVGGGAIFADAELVITQPVEGEFKAFGAICPHQGCVVSQVTEDGIGCACHGSQFSLEDGSVLGGPAEEGLPEKTASAEGADVTVS